MYTQVGYPAMYTLVGYPLCTPCYIHPGIYHLVHTVLPGTHRPHHVRSTDVSTPAGRSGRRSGLKMGITHGQGASLRLMSLILCQRVCPSAQSYSARRA